MAKKLVPELTLIGSEPRRNPLESPANLGETGRSLWLRILNDYVVEDASGLETLFQICSRCRLGGRVRRGDRP